VRKALTGNILDSLYFTGTKETKYHVKKLYQNNTDQASLYLKINSTFKYCRKNAGILDVRLGDTTVLFFKWLHTVFMATDLPPFHVTCQYRYAKLHTNTTVVQWSQNSLN